MVQLPHARRSGSAASMCACFRLFVFMEMFMSAPVAYMYDTGCVDLFPVRESVRGYYEDPVPAVGPPRSILAARLSLSHSSF